jgi:cell division protein FtsL
MRVAKSLICGILIVVMVYFSVNILQTQGQIAKEERIIANKKNQIEKLERDCIKFKEQTILLEEIKNTNDLELIEEYSRKKGLIKDGEILYKNEQLILE